MRLFLLTIFLSTVCVAAGAPPSLPLPQHPTCADLARVANHYIALGEEQTVSDLKRLCQQSEYKKGVQNDSFLETNMREQIGWICRLLFVPQAGRPIRPPGFGALSVLADKTKDEDWPLYPLAESDGVFFVLSQGYDCFGLPEEPDHYLDYCRAIGTFRTAALKMPTETEARQALHDLVNSEAWAKINWKYSGQGMGPTETYIITYLKAQTKPASGQQSIATASSR